MFEWLGSNWWALWLTVFLAFAVVEMLTLSFFFIMLGPARWLHSSLTLPEPICGCRLWSSASCPC
ncbi:conserved hypothetical protein [Arthrobacter sp. Hiyo8]|nr:conserved hypothetical protein [Arthrobacter sp. Hiyo8]